MAHCLLAGSRVDTSWLQLKSQARNPREGAKLTYYLYGSKPGAADRLVATFGSEQQLLAYVRWATLSEKSGVYKFEQGSSLAGCSAWRYSSEPLTDDDAATVDYNP